MVCEEAHNAVPKRKMAIKANKALFRAAKVYTMYHVNISIAFIRLHCIQCMHTYI